MSTETVPKGCKRTEVGVIPEEWNALALKEIGKPVRGGSPRPAGDSRFFNGTFIPWLTVAALTNISDSQIVVTDTATCLTEEGSLRSRELGSGALIIANSGATLGVAKKLGIKCCANDGIAALLNLRSDASVDYLIYYINSKTKYLREVVATGNGQPNLNTELIGVFQVPYPPTLAEQQAIAAALSDADALIESLEQLIAKKRQIKQGAMQELLTGKRRLPGFTGKWEPRKIGSIGSTYGGLTGKTKADFESGTARYVTFMSVMKDVRINPASFGKVCVGENESQNKVLQGDLIFNGSSETPEEVALCALLEAKVENLYLNSFCFGFRIREESQVNGLYLAYYIRSREGRELMKALAQGSTRYNMSKPALMDSSINIPSFPEQSAIAAVLSDMDTELEVLEGKLDKARQVKQGMMQQLLTGKVRLV